jgi:hypothetical protein
VTSAEPIDGSVGALGWRARVASRRDGRVSPCWLAPLAVYALTRGVLYLATVYAAHATPVGGASAMLSSWDAQHFLSIVTQGYPSQVNPALYSTVAFFPGFPLVVRLVRFALRITPLEAGLGVVAAWGALFVVVATRLVASVFGDAPARRAGMLLAAFPGGFVLFVPYAEAQACLCVALALLAAHRGRPYRTAAFGAVATFSSPITIALVPALLARAWRRRDARLALAAVASATGFAAYMVYLGWHTGSLLTWYRVETIGFNAHFSLSAPIDHLRQWPGVGVVVVLDLVVAAVGFHALRRVRAPVEWVVYSVAIVGATLFDSALWVDPRVLLNAFPLVLALGVWLRRDAARVALAVSAALLPVVFLLYFTIVSVVGPP